MNTLREALQEYLELRRDLGFKMRDAGLLLPRFVSFMEQRQAVHITTRLALEWAQHPSVQPAEWARRLCLVRGFARHRSATELFDAVSRFASPYQFNPFNINPLKKVLEDTIDYDCLRNCHSIKLYISATNVRTNRLRIFTSQEISPQVLLASACLPELHHAIEINGDAYWDGGFMGNPILEPLLHNCHSSDVIVVQLNPTQRESIPQTARDIAEREREITLNASLMREIRNIAYITRAAEQDNTNAPRWAKIYLHQISAQEVTRDLSAASKFDTSWPFFTRLRDHGRDYTEAWLTENMRHLSKKTTLPLYEWEDYLDY